MFYVWHTVDIFYLDSGIKFLSYVLEKKLSVKF